jgi:hypothetical protein
MPSNIFSTYSTGENRVTASILAVLRSLSLDRTERLLGALLEQSEFELIRFENQVAKGGEGVADGLIAGSCRILLETKLRRNSVNSEQIQRHLEKLRKANESNRTVVVLTPDDQRPPLLGQLNDPMLTWASFSMLDQAIEELLIDPKEVVSEREEFLLRELQTMLLQEQLIGSSKDVLVVPARHAWPDYMTYSAYVCQADRPFQPAQRMAFYYSGQIEQPVPRILSIEDSVEFSRGKNDGWTGKLVDSFLRDKPEQEGSFHKVMRLSGPDEPETIKLDAPVVNDLRSESGRPVAFTQNQRYISLEKLRSSRKTSELIED